MVFHFFLEKIRIAEKSLLDKFCAVLDPLLRHIFSANIPYLNFQINFQSSPLTKKQTEDVCKRLSSYFMGALNSKIFQNVRIIKKFRFRSNSMLQLLN